MEIVLEKKDAVNATLKVNMTEADYKPKVSAKLKEYSKKAQINGFRPGKVPTALVEKMYGKSIMVEEINQLLSTSVTDYIKSNNLDIIGDPLPDTQSENAIDWENEKNFQFCYDLGLVPEFTYDLSALKLNNYEIEVNDKTVATTLSNLKKQFGKSINPEVSQEGDSLYGEIKRVGADVSVNSVIYLERVAKSQVSKFVGKSKDDVVTFEVSKLFDEAHVLAHLLSLKVEEAAELVGEYEIKIININRAEEADMNQEFFDKVFGVNVIKDEEAFMAKLTETIKENYGRESELLLNRDVKNGIVSATPLQLPDAFLKRWLLLTNQGKITPEQIEKEYDLYLKELKWNLIKNRIAKDNEVKIEYAEVLERSKNNIKQQFGGMEFTGELEDTLNKIAENFLQQDKGRNYMNLYEELLTEKLVATIAGKVKTLAKKITVDEFEKIIAE